MAFWDSFRCFFVLNACTFLFLNFLLNQNKNKTQTQIRVYRNKEKNLINWQNRDWEREFERKRKKHNAKRNLAYLIGACMAITIRWNHHFMSSLYRAHRCWLHSHTFIKIEVEVEVIWTYSARTYDGMQQICTDYAHNGKMSGKFRSTARVWRKSRRKRTTTTTKWLVRFFYYKFCDSVLFFTWNC